jgi:AP-1-like transcription factor
MMADAADKKANGGGSNQFNPYLSPTQQDLLIAALASSNSTGKSNSFPSSGMQNNNTNKPVEHLNMQDISANYLASPEEPTPGSGQFGSISVDDSPFIDYLEADANFDLEPIEGDDMIGDLPGDASYNDLDGNIHEKRKSFGDAADDDEGGGKRREGEDKTAKKPGRKPLTSEPTTVSCGSPGKRIIF